MRKIQNIVCDTQYTIDFGDLPSKVILQHFLTASITFTAFNLSCKSLRKVCKYLHQNSLAQDRRNSLAQDLSGDTQQFLGESIEFPWWLLRGYLAVHYDSLSIPLQWFFSSSSGFPMDPLGLAQVSLNSSLFPWGFLRGCLGNSKGPLLVPQRFLSSLLGFIS